MSKRLAWVTWQAEGGLGYKVKSVLKHTTRGGDSVVGNFVALTEFGFWS